MPPWGDFSGVHPLLENISLLLVPGFLSKFKFLTGGIPESFNQAFPGRRAEALLGGPSLVLPGSSRGTFRSLSLSDGGGP